jgi:hypothetical protein
VAYFTGERVPRRADGSWIDDVTYAPDLVVEILAPGQGRRELTAKCRWYVAHGCRYAWLVDPERRAVARFPRAVGAGGALRPDLLTVPIAPDVEELDQLVSAADLFVDLLPRRGE